MADAIEQKTLFGELKRRNVFRVGAAYLVVAWLLAQVADVALESFAAPDWVMRSILLLLLIGMPLALFFAWAFEMTPEGVKREKDVDRSRSITHQTGRKLDYTILAGIVLLALVIVGDRLLPETATPAAPDLAPTSTTPVTTANETAPPETSVAGSARFNTNVVAVLPFANRSTRPEDAFFAEGVHDDLLTRLSKISALQVISRTSVKRYADSDKPIPEIATELGAAVIMEGAVQRAGQRVRINVQLIDGISDTHLWAENYDRELTTDNLFEIQAEIAHGIANALETVLTGADEDALTDAPTANLAAYDAYIRGNMLAQYENETEARLQAAIAAYEEAIRIDPVFAAAFAGKARAQLGLYWYRAADASYRAAARASIDGAERLAPDAVETLTALGYYYYWGFLDYARADDYLDRALKKAPNSSDAWRAKAFVARRDGRFNDAISALEKARRLDPLHLETAVELIHTYATLGEFPKAAALIREAETLRPHAALLAEYKWRFHELSGDAQRAWAGFEQPIPGASQTRYLERFLAALLTRQANNIAFALAEWPSAQRSTDNYPETYEICRAQALLATGERVQALSLLAEIKARLDAHANPYPAGWAHNAPYRPVLLPGLIGDLAGVREAAADYEKNAAPDAFAQIYIYEEIAEAYVRAGDPETALDYLERLAHMPWLHLRNSIRPAFDSLRDHPRYLALKAAYETWAAAQSLGEHGP